SDGSTYATTYTYDGTSNRIAGIVNSDGTQTNFTYYTTGLAAGYVNTITDGTGHSTTLTYNSGNTVITDASGQTTTLTYDAAGQLTRMQGPTGSGEDIHYTYNANGDVTQSTDSRNNTVTYTYDTNGNQISQQDSAGNTITRTYDSANRLLTETTYATPDPDGSGLGVASNPLTTRYAYDSESHLRFIISPEGRVTEYRYNTQGQRIADIQYTGNQYATGALTISQSLNESDLTTWLGTINEAHSERIDTSYDQRGQISSRTTYASVDSSGNGVTSTQSTTQYVYDQSGNLLQTIDGNSNLTSYSYDGMNRLIHQIDALGHTTNTLYSDSTHQVVVSLANGLSTTSTYDLAGRTLSIAKSDASGALGTTAYTYDSLGRLVQSTDPLSNKTTYLYDTLGRQVGQIDPMGNLTETDYNADGQVTRTVQYATALSVDLSHPLTLSLGTTVVPTKDSVHDRISYNLYDIAGHLTKQIDAAGDVTAYTYDGAGRLLTTTQYANQLTSTQLSAIATTALTAEVLPTDANTLPVADSAHDRVTRNFYSNDGLLQGILDSGGYLTTYTYDAAGEQISSLRYATQSPSTSDTLAQVTPLTDPQDQLTQSIYNARGQLTGSVDAAGYLTEYQYDAAGNRTTTIRYKNAMVGMISGNTLPQKLTVAGNGNYVVTNSEDQSTISTYDVDNRLLTSTSQPDNTVTAYLYDNVGNLISTTKAQGAPEQQTAQRLYDSQGRVIAELSGVGSAALSILVSPTTGQIDDIWNTYSTRYVYDKDGRVSAMYTPDGNTVTGSITPTGKTGNRTLYYYDADGRLTQRIDPLGNVCEYSYNTFGDNVTERHYNTAISSAALLTLTGNGNSTDRSTMLALVGALTGGYSETDTTYNPLDQITGVTTGVTATLAGDTNTRSYNAFGELAGTTDKIDATHNETTNYTYDNRGLLLNTTEDFGGLNRTTAAAYDAFGRVKQTTDGNGNLTNHTYDQLGREVSTTHAFGTANGTTTTTTYDAFSRVMSQTDGRGDITNYSYTSATRSMTMTTAVGITMTTAKNRLGQTVSVTDGNGNVTTYSYNVDGQLTGVTMPIGSTSDIYDKAGHLITTTDANGIVTSYTYDADNQLLTKTVDSTGLNLQTQYRYDAQGRINWTRDADGVWTRTDYDAKGQVKTVTVDPISIPDANGNLIANPSPVGALNLQTTYSYDAKGEKLTVTQGAGSASPRTTQYQYDNLGRRTQTVVDPHLVAGDSKLNITTSYTYDANDNVVLKTDADGNKTVYSYDADNRLVYTVDALGDVTQNTYDNNGNIIATTAYATALGATALAPLQNNPTTTPITVSANSTVDQTTHYVYDKDNRLTYTIDALG
ncbi:MAG TPA: hypothetical protein VIE69_04390, partial [Methylophilaceae bacterium]